MPHRSKDPKQQFAAVDDLLGRWLKGRNTLLSKYTELAVTTETSMDDSELKAMQESLGGLIVDYIGITNHLNEALSSYRQSDVKNALRDMQR